MTNPFRTWFIVDEGQMGLLTEAIGSSVLIEPYHYTTVRVSACGSATARFFAEETRVVDDDIGWELDLPCIHLGGGDE
jgi:hypothetical protein